MSSIDFDNDNAFPACPVGETTAEVARLKTELTHAKQMTAQALADLATVRMLMRMLIDEHDREMREAAAAIERLQIVQASAKPH